jgi:O-antigen/teichoic acid export membrane protein
MKVQNAIGHEEYGTFSALFALGFIFMALADLGVNQYATKTLAGQPGRLRELLPDLFAIKIALAILYPPILVAIGWMLGYSGHELLLLLILCLVHVAMQLIAFFRAGFQAFQYFRLDAVASILDRAFILLILMVLLYSGISLQSYTFSFLFSSVLTLLILYGASAKLWGWLKPKFRSKNFAKLLRASMPFAIIMVLYSVNDKVDQVMLERISGEYQAGLYAAAYRWVDTIMMYLWTVLPIFFARFAAVTKDHRAQEKLLRFGQGISVLPMLFICGFIFVHGEKLFWLLGNSTPWEIAQMTAMLKVLFIAVLINSFFGIYSTVLTSTGHENFVSRMIALSILINVFLNYIFIPEFGGVAASWNTVVSYIFLSGTYLWYFARNLRVRIPFDLLGKLAVSGLLFGAVLYGLEFTPVPWYISSAIAGLVLLGAALGFKLIRLKGGEDE